MSLHVIIHFTLRITSGKNEKICSLHDPVITFTGTHALGLDNSNYTSEITGFSKCKIGGNCVIFLGVNNCLIRVWIWKSRCTHVTNVDLSSQFYFIFYLKSRSVTQRSLIFVKKIPLKRAKPVGISLQNYRLIRIENNFKFFRLRSLNLFEFKVTVHYGLWEKTPSCDPTP